MCASMVDIQSATAEIRRGKKEDIEDEEEEETTGQNIMSASATQGGHNKDNKKYYVVIIFGRPLEKQFALCYLAVVCLPTVCYVGVLWPNGWIDQDATWYGDRPQPAPHRVRWGPNSPTERAHQPTNTVRSLRGQAGQPASVNRGSCLYCGETVAHLSNC